MVEHSALVPDDEGGEENHYRERHELHHDADPGEHGYVGREGAKRHFRKSMKTNRFT
jgi:hypothetical protein